MTERIIDFEQSQIRQGDHIVRGVAADGMIRAFALTSRRTVQTAMENFQASPLVTAALGRLLMAGQMLGCMYKNPDELITIMVRGDGPIGPITVTANTRGQVKGYAAHPNVWLPNNAQGKLDVGGGIGRGTLTVIHDLPGAEPYSSQVELVTGEVGDDLASYFVLSDQVPTSVGVGVLVGRDLNVRQAGGFIIQLMPGHYEYLEDELEANLAGVSSVTSMLEAGMTPTDILQHLLRGMDFKELEAKPVEFHCGCNESRAARATLALGEAELRDMVAKGETAEVYCHFCASRYYLPVERLRELLESGSTQ